MCVHADKWSVNNMITVSSSKWYTLYDYYWCAHIVTYRCTDLHCRLSNGSKILWMRFRKKGTYVKLAPLLKQKTSKIFVTQFFFDL